ncbi:MAG: general secretion pathway protein GspK, partial [Planctomycetaceae bacterium]|nr:general secretion pathway protein GspK [Planctomycetaceae bacterium]
MPSKTRRGTVIVLVLVVIVVLSLAVISFAKLMQAERNGADHNMRQIQTRYLAESGIDAVRTLLLYDDQKLSDMGGVYNNENELCGVLVTDAKDPRDVGRFTVIAPRLDENGMLADLRYGLEDESAKIDLRMVLACEKAKPGAGRQILLGLPGVDETIADSILDWLDEDDDPR